MSSGAGKERIAPETRIVLLLCLSVAVLFVDAVPTLAAVSAAAAALLLCARVGWRKLLFYLLFALAAVWGFLLTQSIFYAHHPRTVLIELIAPETPLIGPLTGGVAVYLEGAVYGAVQSLRFLTLMTAGLTLVWTTSPQRLLQGLRRLRLPFKAAFMVTTALRFLPAIATEARITLAAMRARGYPLRPSRPWSYLNALAAALGPILFRNIRRASMLADSVESRGFGVRSNGGALQREGRGHLERLILIAAPLATLLIVAAKLLSFAAHAGILYHADLEWIYEFVEKVL